MWCMVTIYKSLVFEFPCLTDAQPHYPTKGLLFGEGLVHVVIQIFLYSKLVLDGVLGVFQVARTYQGTYSTRFLLVPSLSQKYVSVLQN